eukprot:CAMPEP_0117686270 /NCGR_PEP_ID=MMETSP0804-20121206/22331_1 /TAXON_ID=1074897 /ORGANISM="Tetraselmis astigmatica, Strain CCMP880" /LENGTH=279 /DNA_ID=CAMNT_0005497893 /DNA_START=141 /DNA_END=976 /DNA_ORIENTATION=+
MGGGGATEKRLYPKVGGDDSAAAEPRARKVLKGVTTFCCPDGYDEAAWKARVDLAACYQLLDEMDMNEGICNHLTVMVPGTTDRFLVIPYGMLWSEVTASNLLLVDEGGNVLEGEGEPDATAFFIHKALHKAGHVAVLHTHMPYSSALCCTKDFKLHMCHQNCLRFHGSIAYDPIFNGLVTDDSEGERIAAAMAGGERVYLHAHHGVIVCGPSVASAFDDLYYLERAAHVQILAMSTGKELAIVDDKVAAEFKATFDEAGESWAKAHFDALKRHLLHGR